MFVVYRDSDNNIIAVYENCDTATQPEGTTRTIEEAKPDISTMKTNSMALSQKLQLQKANSGSVGGVV
jgi:hypothetical protein